MLLKRKRQTPYECKSPDTALATSASISSEVISSYTITPFAPQQAVIPKESAKPNQLALQNLIVPAESFTALPQHLLLLQQRTSQPLKLDS